MKELQLDSADSGFIEISNGLQNLVVVFSGEPKDNMNNHRNPSSAKLPDGGIKAGKRITSADISGSVLVDGLKTKFYPHRLDLIQLR